MKFKRFISVIAISLCVIIFSTGAFASVLGMKESSAMKFFRFNAGFNDRYEAAFDSSGNIRSIESKDPSAYSGTNAGDASAAVAAASTFIENNREMLNIDDPKNFTVVSSDATKGVCHVLFRHYIGRARVLGSEIAVRVNGANEIVSVGSSVKSVKNYKTPSAAVSVENAVAVAMKRVGCSEKRAPEKASHVIYTKNGAPLGAIMVEIPSKLPLGDFVCIVDASTGDVLECTNVLIFADGPVPAAGQNLPLGSIYMFNPLKGPVVNETLLNLTSTGAGLSGKWATVINDDASGATPDASGNYVFAPENTHFDEVNAYYHVNKIHDFYKNNYGFTGLDRQMKVTVHYGDKYDNAFFSPQTGAIAMGDGNKLNDLSKEETVIYHEYTHAATNAIVSLPYSNESGAMSEAFADYFSATISNDPIVGEWAVAKLNKPYIRNLENTAHYPESIHNEVHMDSNVYSGALWDLRKAIGAEASDRLTHYSRYYLKGISGQTFADGLKALVAADREHYAGANAQTIVSVFDKRGIRSSASVSGVEEYKKALGFAALEGDKKAAETLKDIENGNLR